MSTFVTLLYRDLSPKVPLPPSSLTSPPGTPNPASTSTDALKDYYLQLSPPLTRRDAEQAARALENFAHDGAFATADEQEDALKCAVIAKVLLGLYTQTLQTYLDEAEDAETELEWWSDVERSRLSSAYYLLQTLPSRIVNVVDAIMRAVRNKKIPLSPSVFTPSSIRQLFPSSSLFYPHTLIIALFPHLNHEPYPAPILVNARARSQTTSWYNGVLSHSTHVQAVLACVYQSFHNVVALPVSLARHECKSKRERLQKIRDERAAVLGGLVNIRDDLTVALAKQDATELMAGLQIFVDKFALALKLNESLPPVQFSVFLANAVLPDHDKANSSNIAQLGLRRPSRLTLIWPKLVFVPPILLLAARSAYRSKDSLHRMAVEAAETLTDFWRDWLLGPVKDIVKTVRAGSNEGVIITKESVKADLESLERMALSLAREKLNYTQEQMTVLSEQIRHGDLTAVMQIYEDDIRSPLKSAFGGTLLRTLLVQVQKAKVDIDQALSGIDKLLKSQELTFAFVGVAPALAVVYGIVGYLARLWSGSRGRGRYGGRTHRARVWAVIRRIERLLIATNVAGATDIDPRTSGLLLLSTTHLRSYAERRLPANSRLHDGFLEDVTDLEDPALGRKEKLRVVDQMWKSWGQALGWYEIADKQ